MKGTHGKNCHKKDRKRAKVKRIIARYLSLGKSYKLRKSELTPTTVTLALIERNKYASSRARL